MAWLTPHQISPFTKHIVDNKLLAAYQAEVNHVACTVQSGFRPGEEWFMPEANIVITTEQLRDWGKHFLPNIKTWRQQIRCQGGDKTNCAKNFLNKTIPFLVEVVVQCGIYFILDFPTHEMAQRLMAFGGYEIWAHQKRSECALLAATRVENAMWMDQVVTLLSQLVQQNKDLRDNIDNLRQQGGQRQQQDEDQQHKDQQQQQGHHYHQHQQQPAPAAMAAPAPNLPLQEVDQPWVPIVSKKMPDSLKAIRKEWDDNRLASFVRAPNATKLWLDADWKTTIYQAWHKRFFLISTIEDRAKANNNAFNDELERLENERIANGKTASQLWWQQTRKRKRKGQGQGNNANDNADNDQPEPHLTQQLAMLVGQAAIVGAGQATAIGGVAVRQWSSTSTRGSRTTTRQLRTTPTWPHVQQQLLLLPPQLQRLQLLLQQPPQQQQQPTRATEVMQATEATKTMRRTEAMQPMTTTEGMLTPQQEQQLQMLLQQQPPQQQQQPTTTATEAMQPTTATTTTTTTMTAHRPQALNWEAIERRPPTMTTTVAQRQTTRMRTLRPQMGPTAATGLPPMTAILNQEQQQQLQAARAAAAPPQPPLPPPQR
jgi:hypothetical protein